MDLIWLQTGPLHPLEDDSRIRSCGILHGLHGAHQVTYLSHVPEGTPAAVLSLADSYSSHHVWISRKKVAGGRFRTLWPLVRNQLFSSRPCEIDANYSVGYLDALRHEIEHGGHDLLVCDSLGPSLNLLRLDPESIRIPVVLLQHGVAAMAWQRLAATADGALRKAYLENQWQRMVRYEGCVCELASGIIAASPEAARAIRRQYSPENVLGDLPAGVDADSFEPPRQERRPGAILLPIPFNEEPDIALVRQFVQEAYPRVRAGVPSASLTILGHSLPSDLLALADSDDTIRAVESVADLRRHLAEASVGVFPQQSTLDGQTRLLEAMASGLPVVATSDAVAGLSVEDGVHCHLAADPISLADKVARVLRGEADAAAVATAAAELVRRNHSWQCLADRFAELCRRVLP